MGAHFYCITIGSSNYLPLFKKKKKYIYLKKKLKLFFKMGCPALGIWVDFFKQPALPSKASQKKILKKKF
jgi:hypothetical protein